ncbi:hypothetical protein KR067_009932, partial [Drosophila pandora]
EMRIASWLFCVLVVWHNYESLANPHESPVQQCLGFCDLMGRGHDSIYQQEWNKTETRIKALQDQITQIETQLSKSKPKFDNFIEIGTRYFYIEEDFRVTWFTAVEWCRDKGGQLAVIQNEEELNAINAKLDPNSSYWLDINDLAYEGQYESWTSGKRAPYLKWWDGEPNNSNENEDCVLLKENAMRDEACYNSCYYICQSDIVD